MDKPTPNPHEWCCACGQRSTTLALGVGNQTRIHISGVVLVVRGQQPQHLGWVTKHESISVVLCLWLEINNLNHPSTQTGPAFNHLGQLFPFWVQRLRGSVLELSTLSCSSTHNSTLQVLQRTIGPAPPKVAPLTQSTTNYEIFIII